MLLASVLMVCSIYSHCEPPPTFSPEAIRTVPTTNPNPKVKSYPLAGYEAPPQKWGQAVEQWRPLVAGQFPPEQVEMALCVIYGESRGDPRADNPTSSARGLFQFLKSTWNKVAVATNGPNYDSGAPYNPEISTYYAAWLWADSGWGQWSAAARC